MALDAVSHASRLPCSWCWATFSSLLSTVLCLGKAGDEKGLTEQVFFDDPQPFRFGSTHPKDGGQSPVRVTVK